ncbi:hypothetical protein IGJ68_002158 [Enterococcus sp. DIV0564]|uniref:Blp family class II bacteriocin n=1 Tax=Enterococcus TaxID=1350 RepID=UPI001A961C5D|nr:Blp family class II bacteriocin [Enterococcus faecalis]
MTKFKELTVQEMKQISGGKHGKPIYFKDLPWAQQKCILSVAGGALIGTTTGGPLGALLGAGSQAWGCL